MITNIHMHRKNISTFAVGTIKNHRFFERFWKIAGSDFGKSRGKCDPARAIGFWVATTKPSVLGEARDIPEGKWTDIFDIGISDDLQTANSNPMDTENWQTRPKSDPTGKSTSWVGTSKPMVSDVAQGHSRGEIERHFRFLNFWAASRPPNNTENWQFPTEIWSNWQLSCWVGTTKPMVSDVV